MIERQLAKSSRCWKNRAKNVELDRLQAYTASSPPVHKREILVRAPKDFIFKIYQKAYDASTRALREAEKQSAVARTPYGLLTALRDASPQVAPSFDYGSPFFTRS